jgi:hypothetical protein
MKHAQFILVLFVSVYLVGCGPAKYPSDWPKTYPCTITVTKGGQPLEDVMVLLARTEKHGSWAVSGKTDASGVAEIETSWTHAVSKGAPEGTFKVTLSKTETPPPPSKSDAELEAMSYDERAAFLEAEAEKIRNASAFPASISDPATTQVRIEVKPGTPAEFTIDVNDYR